MDSVVQKEKTYLYFAIDKAGVLYPKLGKSRNVSLNFMDLIQQGVQHILKILKHSAFRIGPRA